MKLLKKFENFLTYNIKDLYELISLYKIADKIYCVKIEDQYLRSMVFLRCQEYYESPSSEFHRKKFKWDRFMSWYKSSESPYGKKDIFTYGNDWSGFNLPSDTIEDCLSDIEDKNIYDDIMISIVSTIRMNEKNNFYLISVDKINSNDLLDHELAHGFYYTHINYKNKMDNITSKLPIDIRKIISDSIIDLGYNESVLKDEIQAYMSTGIISRMDKKLNLYTKEYEVEFKKFKDIYGKSNPIKIEINFDK